MDKRVNYRGLATVQVAAFLPDFLYCIVEIDYRPREQSMYGHVIIYS